jgi:GntR family transcriptional regulator
MENRRFVTLQLGFRSGSPAYVQIVGQIERQIAAGRLRPGDQLPTVRELAAQLDLNFNTTARAYRLLDLAGLVSTQRGRGTYILSSASTSVLQPSRRQALEALAQRYIDAALQYRFTEAEIAAVFEQRLSRRKTAA